MAVLTKSTFAGAHWYTTDGQPAHKMPRKNGEGDRATTLADARRLHLLPSVTSILGTMAKPGLDTWKQQQVALAALRTPKTEEESPDYWAKRVIAEAFAQVEHAADLGSEIHAALESGNVPDHLAVYCDPVFKWKGEKGINFIEREVVLVNREHGFAGTCDVVAVASGGQPCILDFKTRRTKPGQKVTSYDGQAMQIAAYGATYWGENDLDRVFGANVYISTTEPGRMDVVTYKPEQLDQEWQAFLACCQLWRHFRQFDPRVL